MSSRDAAAATAVVQVASVCDGALAGVVLGFFAFQTWVKYFSTTSALRRIRSAPSARVYDLRDLIPDESSNSKEDGGGGFFVVVRGVVQPRATVEATWSSSKMNGAIISQGSGERAVVVQRTQTCLYNEWRGIFGWTFDLHAIFAKSWKEHRSTSLKSVPFTLVEDSPSPRAAFIHENDPSPRPAFIHVNLDGSHHKLPLVTAYHHMHPISNPYTLFQAIFGQGFPVAILDEEKILPVGREITAVGMCRIRGEALEIISCKELPLFLTDMTKGEIEVDLAKTSRILLWTGIALGSFSIGILGYAIVRYWHRWKEWSQQRQRNHNVGREVQEHRATDDDSGDVPEGQLCVICLMRRRRCAFIPCGHLVCCPDCTLSVERESSPKCPVCRQSIRSFVRIYES